MFNFLKTSIGTKNQENRERYSSKGFLKNLRTIGVRSFSNSFNKIVGKKHYQNLFRIAHKYALRGMNYGGGAGVNSGGELFVLEYVRNVLGNEKPVIFDVGANTGVYSLAVDRVFQGKAEIYAFEPAKEIYKSLLSNIKKTEIQAYRLGIGESKGYKTLYSNKKNSGLSSLYKRRLQHFGLYFDREEKIEITTLDDFCKREGIEHINLLKLDIEGNEMMALRGASNLIEKGAIDMIQFEFGGCNIDSKTYMQDFFYFLGNKYTINRILKNGFEPLGKYQETYEVFVTTNYLAIRKHKNKDHF